MLAGAAMAGLAACSADPSRTDAPTNGTDTVSAGPMNEAQADAALGGIVGVETDNAAAGNVAGARGASLPATLVGVWAERSADCHDAGQTRVTIEPRRLIFYGSVAAVDRVTALPDGTTAIDVTVRGGGATSPHSWNLSLSPDGRVLTQVEGGVPDIGYARCVVAP